MLVFARRLFFSDRMTTTATKTAVILMNTGSPSAPTEVAVRAYLLEFLTDRRIIELPAWFWQPILNRVILPKRPAKSAERYRQVWMPEGSPLVVYMNRVARELRARLPEHITVETAMRVGFPDVNETMGRLRAAGFERFLFWPLFAQYSTQTTESALDAVREYMAAQSQSLNWGVIGAYWDSPGFIEALAKVVETYRTPEHHLVMSFHGIPYASIQKGSPYERHCLGTAERLAQALDIGPKDFSIAYQSRFGKGRWLQPYLTEHVEQLLRSGIDKLDVACLSFSVDCLETLEEIGIELKKHFLAAGGKELHLLPCMNAEEAALSFYQKHIEEAVAKFDILTPKKE